MTAASVPEKPCIDCTHDYCRCAARAAATEAQCPDCHVERADYEGPNDEWLPTCPNCGSQADPVLVPIPAAAYPRDTAQPQHPLTTQTVTVGSDAPAADFDLIRRALDLMPWSGEGRRDAKAAALEAVARLEAKAAKS